MNTKVEKIKLLIEGISDFSDVESDVGKFRKVLNELSLPKELKTSFKNTFGELENEAKNYQRILNSGFKTKKDITGLEESGKKIKGLMSDLLKSLGKIKGEDLKNSLDFDEGELKKAREEVEKIKKQLEGLDKTAFNNASKSLKDSFKELSKLSKAGVVKDLGIKINADDFQGTLDQIKEIESYLRSNPFKEGTYDLGGGKYDEFKKQLEAIKNIISTLANDPVTDLKNQLAQADVKLADLTTEEVNALIKVFGLLGDKTEEAKQNIEDNQRATEDLGRAQKSLNDEVENIKNGVAHFFSLSNAANMFKSAVHNAFKTVQELDKIMTETAVVTDFSVSDMWDQLPQYTEMANELGVAIADVYSASTLYYQQGLKTNEVMDITTETLKMARIASIDASKTTNYMTAALRGFNMEIDEMNAQRINDVYSELAAITAADTGQIATAMTKTASIAASANMEFESTAALLSQIIETTQEAPETAGTALKTIIARFSEVKKLQSEGKNEGTDEEGEAINVNNIDKALKSVGISMDAFFAGTEGLDNVLFRLAEKWKTLDFETQRYIATTAAGSRQQSRFIAMMSDYERTMELTNAANNSAGASQRQFGKTTESLQSKLNKLKNAWDQFLMGIANSDIIKGIVDIVTFLVESLNGLINTISGDNGALKSVTSLATAIIGLWGGSKLANAAIGTFASTLLKGMPVAKQFTKEGGEIPKIFKEFKDEIIGLPGLLGKMKDGFKGAKGELGGIKGILSGLKGGIKAVFSATPILSWTIAIGAAFGALKLFTWIYDTWFNQEKILQRRLEQSQKVAENLKTEYNELKSSISSIDAKDAELDNIIIGTQEWNDKVHELNSEISELIDKYPQLAKYVDYVDGRYILTDGYETEVNNIQQDVKEAENVVARNELLVLEKELENYLKNNVLQTSFYGGPKGESTYLSTSQQEKLYKEIVSNPLFNENDLFKFLEENKIAYDKAFIETDELEKIIKDAYVWEKKFFQKEAKKEVTAAQLGLTEHQYNQGNNYVEEKVSKMSDDQVDLELEKLLPKNWTVEGLTIKNIGTNEVIETFSSSDDKRDYLEGELLNTYVDPQAIELGYEYRNISSTDFANHIASSEGLDNSQASVFRETLNKLGGYGINHAIDEQELKELANLIFQGKNPQDFIDKYIANLSMNKSVGENAKEIEGAWKEAGKEIEKADELSRKIAGKWKTANGFVQKMQETLADPKATDKEKVTAVSNALAVDEKIAKDLLKEEPELFNKIAAGGSDADDALQELQGLAGSKFLLSIGYTKEEIKDISTIINDMPDFDINGTADFTEIYKQLVNFRIAMGEEAEEAVKSADAILAAWGIDITANVTYKEVKIPKIESVEAGNGGYQTMKWEGYEIKKVPEIHYAEGTKRGSSLKTNGGGGNTGGGKTGGSKSKNWENPYDKFYNITEKINEELRVREKLENRYDRLLKSRKSTTQELNKLYLNQIASLRKENDLQQQMANGRKSQIQNLKSEKFTDSNGKEKSFSSWGVTKYASYDFKTNTIKIDWEAINKIKDEDLGSAVEEYISKLEEYSESYEEALDTIESNTDETRELQSKYISDYLELEQRVYDAIVEDRQRQIDEFSSLSDTLSEANERIISSLQESIDLERQIRDNTKTEEEINDMEARLAYLRRDTSGGNAVEIAQLEEELANARESYGDTLVDQEIERLSKQSEEAAAQRERQIEIMQAQLDYEAENGAFWNETYALIEEAVSSKDINNTGMAELLKETDAFKAMSRFGQNQWILEMVEAWNKSEQGLNQAWLQEAKDKGYIEQNGKKYTYDEETNSWKDAKGNMYDVSRNSEEGKFEFTLTKAAATTPTQPSTPSTGSSTSYYKKANKKYNGYLVAGLNSIGVNSSYSNRAKIAKANGYSNYSGTPAQNQALSKLLVEGKLKKYATGGLATSTGLAWLDGTKSKPELVLNAKDTENFISLKNVLASLMRDDAKAQSGGDNYFDIHINVDELGSDYDVDQLVTRIKQKIYEDSSYRNVNTINFIR